MNAPKGRVELANFVCTYDEKPLLHEFDRFFNAVSNPRMLQWKKGETHGYKFINVELFDYEGQIFIIGRLVKKIIHVSSQKLDDEKNQLQKLRKKMPDDPSSLFIIRLFDHKIIVVNETKKAPRLLDFKNAFFTLLKVVDEELLDNEFEKYKKKLGKQRLTPEERAIFDGYFYTTYPKFNLSITSIGSDHDVEKIFANIGKINTYRIRIPHSNDENPDIKSAFLKTLAQNRVLAGTDKTTSSEVVFRDSEVGLSKQFMKEITTEVGNSGGMFGFNLGGKTDENEDLNISEEKIKVNYTVPLSSDKKITAQNAIKKFNGMISKGYVRLAKMADENEMLKTAREIYGKYNSSDKQE